MLYLVTNRFTTHKHKRSTQNYTRNKHASIHPYKHVYIHHTYTHYIHMKLRGERAETRWKLWSGEKAILVWVEFLCRFWQ